MVNQPIVGTVKYCFKIIAQILKENVPKKKLLKIDKYHDKYQKDRFKIFCASEFLRAIFSI